MVQTRSAAKAIASGQAHDAKDTTIEIPSESGSASAEKHRRQDVAAHRKRRRGKPGELCQLNLDVLFLIAEYIHPLDLLNLARTCKSLRVLLMDKSSAFIWRSARRQVKGLPDLPADLTEPEYANLVFYARCHGCGKHTKAVYWQIRRRYCSNCRGERLYDLFLCDAIIRNNDILGLVRLTVERSIVMMVDKEQKDSFMEEYERSIDKKQFLCDKQEQCVAIRRHARECEDWQLLMAVDHQTDLKMRRQQRATSIFERLKQHGYDPEITHFGRFEIQNTRRSLFRTSKPLTDKEWDRVWPEWFATLNNLRSRRLQCVVYRPRRIALASEYATYVTNPPPIALALDLLPHVVDLACMPPFRDCIKAPEDAQSNAVSTASVFAQLPALVDEWRKKLDAELVELVHIPSHLSIPGTSDIASNNTTTHTGSASDRLRLACALFHVGREDVFTHPDVFLVSMRHYVYPCYAEDDTERTGSIRQRYQIEFLEEAPFIVRACGLDPIVATVEDMDRRNARLKCTSCQNSPIGNWRDAVRHARGNHLARPAAFSEPRWQIVSDEFTGTELSIQNEWTPQWARCLLCLPRVANALSYSETKGHLKYCHRIEEGDIEQGVHWAFLGVYEGCSAETAEERARREIPRYEALFR